MHAKTWLCYGLVYLGGSANFTNNSFSNNIENLLIAKTEEVLFAYLQWFGTNWAVAAEV